MFGEPERIHPSPTPTQLHAIISYTPFLSYPPLSALASALTYTHPATCNQLHPLSQLPTSLRHGARPQYVLLVHGADADAGHRDVDGVAV